MRVATLTMDCKPLSSQSSRKWPSQLALTDALRGKKWTLTGRNLDKSRGVCSLYWQWIHCYILLLHDRKPTWAVHIYIWWNRFIGFLSVSPGWRVHPLQRLWGESGPAEPPSLWSVDARGFTELLLCRVSLNHCRSSIAQVNLVSLARGGEAAGEHRHRWGNCSVFSVAERSRNSTTFSDRLRWLDFITGNLPRKAKWWETWCASL